MCKEIDMIENTLLITTAIATAFAAIAAWCSFEVARRSLDFQKKYAKNQNLLNEINRSIYKVETLQILLSKDFRDGEQISDDQIESIEPLLKELKYELERFGNRSLFDYGNLKISSISNIPELLRGYASLAEVISELENEKYKIFE
jgi:hypothetical protein